MREDEMNDNNEMHAAMSDADHAMLPLLAGWLDGELSAEDAARVQAALKRSATLRAVLAEWRSVDSALTASEPQRSAADWEALAQRVEHAIADDGKAAVAGPSMLDRIRSQFGTRTWAIGGSGALAAVVLLVLLWPVRLDILDHTGVAPKQTLPSLDTAPTPGAPTSTEADQPALANDVGKRGIASPSPSPAPAPAPARESKELAQDIHAPAIDEMRQRQPVPSNALKTDLPEVVVPRQKAVVPEEEQVVGGGKDEVATSPAARVALPTPKPSMFRLHGSPPATGDSDEAWLARNTQRLDAAVASGDGDSMQSLITETAQRRDTDADATNAALLAFSIRCRCELLRLAPEAIANTDACPRIRTDYNEWQRIVAAEERGSAEAVRMVTLVRKLCPE
jgi:hypothetical protein